MHKMNDTTLSPFAIRFTALALLTLLLAIATPTLAQPTHLAVGAAKTKKAVIAFTPASVTADKATSLLAQVNATIEKDLNFTDLFRLMPSTGFPQSKIASQGDFKKDEWLKTGTDYVSYGAAKMEGDKLIYEFHFLNVGTGNEVLAKRYTSDSADTKLLAHSIANDIVFAITGRKGIFLTKIVFVCDRTGKKEVYSMNFDGSEPRQVTKIRSIIQSPAWNHDGSKIAFAVINRHSDNTKNNDLFEYSFKTAALKVLSNKKGINSGANYSSDGRQLALTMSYTGNPEIHVMDVASRSTRQLTHSVGFDVDPSFSPDGSKIAFVSSRPGKPMVYIMPVSNPNEAKRVTFAGEYNASPNWHPDGKLLVFAGWIDKHFDLFTITSDGGKIERLTKDEGNNEDPHWSPDGNFVTFSSNRKGEKSIFVMNADGTNARKLTAGLGGCTSPKWSPYL